MKHSQKNETEEADSAKDKKYVQSNEKRLLSNIEMRNQYKQQKQQIRAALSNVDGAIKSNKIIFSDEGDIENLGKRNKKRQLFAEGSDNEDDIASPFELKRQFEGRDGHRLLQLQSKFQNDRRFVMNERFLENGGGDDGSDNNTNLPVEDEKQAQFNILQEVLGKKVTPKAKEKSEKQKVMLRFDPSDPQHKTYELKQQEEQSQPPKKKKRKELPPVEEEVPQVSEDKFYKVAGNLKDVFQSENKTFSLLPNRRELEFADGADLHQIDESAEATKDKSVRNFNGAFNSDSSDEEEEESVAGATGSTDQKFKKKESLLDRVRFWSEPFFFKEDDYRFQEGTDFIKRLGSQSDEDFLQLRRSVKGIVRAKVRNISRKNGLFKKKLGGSSKRMKIKRALKR